MIRLWLHFVLTTILISLSSLIVACNSSTPPTEFAPDGEIVKKAIVLQLTQNFQGLSNQLNTTLPQLKINQIQVKQLDSILVAQLSTYHLQGTYNFKLMFPRQVKEQKKNQFDIYLQRQIEGETWRLLRREYNLSYDTLQWKSYLIR
ncbi:hypothetical protein [cyanobacterium endosymbiont of Epithemia clementina EcSB]|uniref:hypothetical protein n=1 Tax=cyanobacterium endosymbiont of Epithemia clementina EcSB TaxID=3034674 RepID=UPI00247FED0D|nr:hypothetical protein [cyanobacterium endosymbiont of Epithemia clementina EcSB]WGT67383.1 hypothetical protein P3F56_09320 [cyanobacterium endosymbiont of Epithemia clementina EcSB]